MTFIARPREISVQRAPLLVLEAATVVLLFALALRFARPELEAWAVIVIFRDFGPIGALQQFFSGSPTRLLEHLLLGIAAFLPLSAPPAIGLAYAIVIAAKYLAARWAVSTVASGPSAWLLATVAAVMLPWSDHWRGHNLGQETAAFFLIVAVGWALRLRSWQDPFRIAALAAFVLLSLFAYEGLIACALAIPLLAFIGSPRRPEALAACVATVFAAVALFAMLLLASAYFNDHAYHVGLARGDAYTHPLQVFRYLYGTVYLDSPWMLPALVIVAIAAGAPPAWRRFPAVALTVEAGLAVVPLFSLVYAVNLYFLSDPARVGLPAGFGFFLLCVLLAAMRRGPAIPGLMFAAVVTLIGAAALNGQHSFQSYRLQRALLDQVKAIAAARPASTYIVRDFTGRYGDMYTFLVPDTFPQALRAMGTDIKAVLCTPRGVERVHPIMQRSGNSPSGLDWCDGLTLPVTEPMLTLDVRANAQGEPIVSVAAN